MPVNYVVQPTLPIYQPPTVVQSPVVTPPVTTTISSVNKLTKTQPPPAVTAAHFIKSTAQLQANKGTGNTSKAQMDHLFQNAKKNVQTLKREGSWSTPKSPTAGMALNGKTHHKRKIKMEMLYLKKI